MTPKSDDNPDNLTCKVLPCCIIALFFVVQSCANCTVDTPKKCYESGWQGMQNMGRHKTHSHARARMLYIYIYIYIYIIKVCVLYKKK